MYRSLLLLIIAVLLPGYACTAQPCNISITIKVQELHNTQPLYPVTIYIDELHRSVQTNEHGIAKLEQVCAGEYTVHCVLSGYEAVTHKIQIIAPQQFTIDMTHLEGTLGNVTINDTRANALLQTHDALDKDALSSQSGKSIGDLLQSINGVTVLANGATIAKPVIHGLHSNRIVMLNNGIRQEDQQWGTEHAPDIDPMLANTITVIKGAAGVRYGTDAIGGVVLVEPSALRSSPGWSGEVNLAAFSNNRMGLAEATLEHNFKKIPALSFRVQGTWKKGGNYHIPGYWVANTGVREKDYSATLRWQKAHYSAEAFYSHFETDLGIYTGSHTGNEDDLNRAIASPSPLVQSGFSYAIGRPRQHVAHDLYKLKLNADTKLGYWSLTYALQHNFRQEYDVVRVDNGLAQLNLTLNTQTVNLNFEHKAWGRIKGQMGIDGTYQDNYFRNGDRLFIPSYQTNGIAAYWIERWKKDRWTIETGLRYDYKTYDVANPEGSDQHLVHYNYNFSNSSGTLGLHYQLKTNWDVSLTLANAWRAPQPSELFSAGLHNSAARIELGDKNLVPEKSFNFNLESKYTWNNKLSAELSLYRQYINHYIYLQPGGDILTIQGYFKLFNYTQTDATLTGMDATVKYQWTKHLSSEGKASLLRAWDRTANDWLILMPSDRLSLNTKYQTDISKTFSECYLGFVAKYVFPQTRIPDNFDAIDHPRPPADYFLLNLEAGTKLLLHNHPIYVSLDVTNALNKKYRDYLDAFRYFIDQPGTNAVLRLRVPFSFGS